MELTIEIWKKLETAAWLTRENSIIFGDTRVGASLITESGTIFCGCNIEHRYRCHDIHAEVNAISNMIANGERGLVAILVVAERHKFTPCGSCMDWIMQIGGEDCIIAYQNKPGGVIHKYFAKELMPHYPA